MIGSRKVKPNRASVQMQELTEGEEVPHIEFVPFAGNELVDGTPGDARLPRHGSIG